MNTIHLLDLTGSVFAFFSTVFYIRASQWAWPIGLVAVSIDIYLYARLGIYGDMSLTGFYFISTFYGWYIWAFGGKDHHEKSISCAPQLLLIILGIIAISGILVGIFMLKHYTNSQVPYLDSITTVLSLVAQFLICRKYIQCWILWFAVDAIYVGLYCYKGIPAHAVLHSVYVIMAVMGYLRWQRLMRKEVQGDLKTCVKNSKNQMR